MNKRQSANYQRLRDAMPWKPESASSAPGVAEPAPWRLPHSWKTGKTDFFWKALARAKPWFVWSVLPNGAIRGARKSAACPELASPLTAAANCLWGTPLPYAYPAETWRQHVDTLRLSGKDAAALARVSDERIRPTDPDAEALLLLRQKLLDTLGL